MHSISTLRRLAGACLGLCIAPAAAAQFTGNQIPVRGATDPAFSSLDTTIRQAMASASPQVTAVNVAVMDSGRVMYQRSFGWRDGALGDQPLFPTDRMRVASVTKPVTAAAIWQLVNDGIINWSTPVFDFGQATPGTGILPADVYFPTVGLTADPLLPQITVQDLLLHRGGWDADAQFNAAAVVAATPGAVSPPGVLNTVRYMMGQPLTNVPGTAGTCASDPTTVPNYCYSNFGYLLLALVIEEATGMTYMDYVQSTFLSQWGGSPNQVQHGRGLKVDQDPTEPLYETTYTSTSVYPPYGVVSNAYGRWEHEVFLGHGDLIMTPLQMLHFSSRYVAFSNYPNLTRWIGAPFTQVVPFTAWTAHDGSIEGTYSRHVQKGSTGRSIAIIVNQRDLTGGGSAFVGSIYSVIQGLIDDPAFVWPTRYADDTWVEHVGTAGGDGTYASPFEDIQTALGSVQDGGRLKLIPSDSTWTGTIDQRVILEGPIGAARLGKL